jgi:FLVCR family MFS transporter 7
MLAAWLNGAGAVLRIISVLDGVPSHYRYAILLTGQTIAGCAQPFVLFAPTKLASQWFANDQRTLANMVGSTGKIKILLCYIKI